MIEEIPINQNTIAISTIIILLIVLVVYIPLLIGIYKVFKTPQLYKNDNLVTSIIMLIILISLMYIINLFNIPEITTSFSVISGILFIISIYFLCIILYELEQCCQNVAWFFWPLFWFYMLTIIISFIGFIMWSFGYF